MWCPSCKAEYVEGITECPDCHVPLVKELSQDIEETADTSDMWKLAGDFTDEIQAQLAEGMIREKGIQCWLENVTFHSAPVPMSGDMTRIRLWVDKEHLEEARSILADTDTYFVCSECGAVVTQEDMQCPTCGETLEDDETE